MTTRQLMLGIAAIIGIVVLCILATPSGRDVAIAAIGALMALLIRGGDHVSRPPTDTSSGPEVTP